MAAEPGGARRGRLRNPALVALFTFVGFELGVVGAFLVPVVLPSGIPGLAIAVAVVGNLLAGWLAGRALGTGVAALGPAIGWIIAALLASLTAPNTSLIIPASIPGITGGGLVTIGFLVVGFVAALAPIAFGPRPHRRPPLT